MKAILFIEPLYNQTIKGLKIMTRREGSLKAINDNPDDWKLYNTHYQIFKNIVSITFENKNGQKISLKPRLLVGDIVRLNEPYIKLNHNTYGYRFNGGSASSLITINGYNVKTEDGSDLKWKNKMFMPAEAARAFVKITSVRCERLLDITDEDCIAEGIEEHPRALFESYKYKNYSGDCLPIKAKDSFLSLFKFANKVKEVKNIYVWVYSYVLCDKEGKEIKL